MRCLPILAGIAVLLLVAIGVVLVPNPLGAAIAGTLYDTTLDSTLTYRVQVWTDTPLHDMDLILPLPGGPEGAVLVDALARGEFTERPEGWQLTILEADTLSMLKIHADRFGETPGEPSLLAGLARTAGFIGSQGPWEEDLVLQVRPGRVIATDVPGGNEPLLQPRYNVTASGCGCSVNAAGERSERFVYDSTLFTGFQSPGDANLAVWIQVRGVNRWWAYHWSSNYYTDSVRLIVSEGSGGWSSAAGVQTQKNGRYGKPTGF
ncbi:MAG: hypothetical protein LUQ41_07490 [Methanomicrobiales archaeon]|nr:hypothetical protein [Methanomicrobiales archaeon]